MIKMKLGEILIALREKLSVGSLTASSFIANLIVAAVIFTIGLILGKLVKFLLKRLFEVIKLKLLLKPSTLNLFLTIIKWSVYIVFFQLALNQLGIPSLTSWLTNILSFIPALVFSGLLIITGFAIASYCKQIFEEDYNRLGVVLYYFIFYLFVALALKFAFVYVNLEEIVNIVLIIGSAIFGLGIIINLFINRLKTVGYIKK